MRRSNASSTKTPTRNATQSPGECRLGAPRSISGASASTTAPPCLGAGALLAAPAAPLRRGLALLLERQPHRDAQVELLAQPVHEVAAVAVVDRLRPVALHGDGDGLDRDLVGVREAHR